MTHPGRALLEPAKALAAIGAMLGLFWSQAREGLKRAVVSAPPWVLNHQSRRMLQRDDLFGQRVRRLPALGTGHQLTQMTRAHGNPLPAVLTAKFQH
jgi:hypothetical protein